MNIYVREVGNKGVFDAYLGFDLLCRSSASPLLNSARTLLALGVSPDEPLRMFHHGASVPSLTTTIGAAARLEIGGNGYGQPVFNEYRTGKSVRVLSEAAE